MEVIILQLTGVGVFLLGTAILGARIRRKNGGERTENASRTSHALYWGALVAPGLCGFVYPGLAAYDGLLGLPGLPPAWLWPVSGSLLLCVGALLMVAANRSLVSSGKGAAAFLLTRDLATTGIYARTRNPMSLGFYAAGVGIGLVAESVAVTLGVLLVVMPVHILNLKFFEERELLLRFGPAYADYQRRVPFLLPRLRNREARAGGRHRGRSGPGKP